MNLQAHYDLKIAYRNLPPAKAGPHQGAVSSVTLPVGGVEAGRWRSGWLVAASPVLTI